MKVALETLGCKLNQAETELIAKQLIEASYKLVPRVDEADIYILNTCTVTHVADAKSRHLLRQAHRRNPSALVVATGCYAQRVPQELAKINGVSLVVDNEHKAQLSGLLPVSHNGNALNELAPLRTRSFVKVMDGCGNFCSYCIVPFVRGREKSLPPGQIVAEVKQRMADGYQEVVLTGTKVGAYDYEGVALKSLLESVLAETNLPRIRLSSLQPQEISAELLHLWRNERLCPHFHLSLQSGSDSVLERMKRRYSTSDFEKTMSLIRSLIPDAAITTDVIVGFPGETPNEFEESYDFCRRIEFARIHVFPYSKRSGTEAYHFLDQISDEIKKERSQRMLALAKESADNFRRRFIGKTLSVLWEKRSSGLWSGLTDNYIRVYIKSNQDLTNKVLPVKVEEFNPRSSYLDYGV
ncbi:MAG: tRNA (N(6)-L-threonylcarbamoyladenosine(37)-C(2))-methylthiotransferase MtaB [Chloroflexota bacterium]